MKRLSDLSELTHMQGTGDETYIFCLIAVYSVIDFCLANIQEDREDT